MLTGQPLVSERRSAWVRRQRRIQLVNSGDTILLADVNHERDKDKTSNKIDNLGLSAKPPSSVQVAAHTAMRHSCRQWWLRAPATNIYKDFQRFAASAFRSSNAYLTQRTTLVLVPELAIISPAGIAMPIPRVLPFTA
jgi:hypothetical protein